MSRRNPDAGKAAQNQQTLKSLVKLEGNKSCSDCKKNKHPRWASWNLGIFICIRCSGIHRGMGTHISRVKSVDLDSWTDEQLQSMLRWGNNRANKYWEAKLAPGHVPADAKIENFIRTKYDTKRWAMDGPMPDPSTLDAGDDDAPLNVVQEKAKLDRASSLRNASTSSQPISRPTNNIDLFGDEPARPQRPLTTEPAISARPPPVRAPQAAPPKQNKPAESLLGLDFFGGSQSAPPARPASAASASTPGVSGRSDLKQSILSLYASAPKPAAAPAQTSSQQMAGMSSQSMQSSNGASKQSFGGMDDAFSSLSFTSSTPQPPAPKSTPFSGMTSPVVPTKLPSAFPSGGSFFDSKPVSATNLMVSPLPPQPPTPLKRMSGGFGDFGDFTSAAPPTPPVKQSAAPAAASSMGDLFSMSSSAQPRASAQAPAPAPVAKQPPPISASNYAQSSAFNLSTPSAPQVKSKPVVPQAANFAAMNNTDAWGSTDAWGAPDPEPVRAAPPPQTAASTTTYKAPATTSMSDDFGGWGSNTGATPAPQPTVTEDDDFGGWSSAAPVTPAATTTHTAPAPAPAATGQAKPFGGGDDLFGNVWE